MSDIRQQLLAAFEVEHREHIAAIRQALAPGRAGDVPDLRDVFRHAHSLKGAARAVDLLEIEALAHRLESVLAEVVEGRLALEGGVARAIDLALDSIEAYVAAGNRGEALPALGAAQDALAALAVAPPEPEAPAAELPRNGPDALSLAQAKQEPLEFLRVRASEIDLLSGSVHELAREVQSQEERRSVLRGLQSGMRALREAWDGLQPALRSLPDTRDKTLRVAGISEQLRAVQRALAELAAAQGQSGWALNQTAQRLREGTERIALVPAELVFGDLGRMVRAIARDQGKTVTFAMTGLQIQADRQVLQTLRDPLIHLLRNAISHGGRESEADRAAQGKPQALAITVTATAKGGQLLLSVRDDGPGPDLEAIEAVAVETGLLAPRPAGAAAPTTAHLLELVFRPGFSTARGVDTLAGRGVGLSAVAEGVRRLHGRVRFTRAQPWGSEISITVPLSAAQQSLVFVGVGENLFGLPAAAVERLLRFAPSELAAAESGAVLRIELEGEDVIVHLASLGALLNMQATPPAGEGGKVNAVLLRQGARRLALAVDRFEDVREAVVASAGILGADARVIAGSVLLSQDAPALVLDPDGLFERWRLHGPVPAPVFGVGDAPGAHTGSVRRIRTILVVDDSITTRTLEKSILEAQGYRVLLGVDGIDGLNALRAEDVPIDLVVADVEMPRLDGFGLLQAMKNEPRFASIPVILVTSRDDPENIRRGLELGAGAYITKQKFDQRELLDTIGQLL